MTRISPTLYPAPAGHTKAAPTHGTKARSCREKFGALTSVKGNQCAPTEGVPTPPLPLGHPQHTIPQAFERLNAPQMRRDRMDSALPPVWLMLISAATCVLTMLLADTLYGKFFLWITGFSL